MCSAPGSSAWRASTARCRPTAPATTVRAGCWPWTRRDSVACGRAGSTRWRRSTASTAPPSASTGSLTSRRSQQLELDREYRTFACGDEPYPVVDQAFELLARHRAPRRRSTGAVLGRLPHRQHDLRRRPAGGGGARLGDGHRRRPRAGPGLVPAARPPPHEAFDVPRLARPARPGRVDRPVGGGQRSLRRAPRVVRAARRHAVRLDHGAGDEAARLERRRSRVPPRWPSTRPAAACSPRCSTSAADKHEETRCSRPPTTCRSTRWPSPSARPATSDRNFYDRYYFNCHPCSDELFLIMGHGPVPEPRGAPTPSPSCGAATSTVSCGPPASSGSTGSTPRSARSRSR